MSWLWNPPVIFVNFWWDVTILVMFVGAITWGIGSLIRALRKGSRPRQ